MIKGSFPSHDPQQVDTAYITGQLATQICMLRTETCASAFTKQIDGASSPSDHKRICETGAVMRPDVEQTGPNPVPQVPRRDPVMPIHVSLGGRNRATISPTEGLVLSPGGPEKMARDDWWKHRESLTRKGPITNAAALSDLRRSPVACSAPHCGTIR